MIYFVALLLSLVVCAQSAALTLFSGNITHLKNGREPNAGVALFPAIPMLPLLALGVAWCLRQFMPASGIWVLIGSFLVYSVIWLVQFVKLRAELRRAMTIHSEKSGG